MMGVHLEGLIAEAITEVLEAYTEGRDRDLKAVSIGSASAIRAIYGTMHAPMAASAAGVFKRELTENKDL